MVRLRYVTRRVLMFVAVILLALVSFCGYAWGAVADFSHPDENPRSPRSGQMIGPYDEVNTGKITMWYFQYYKY